MVRTTNQVSLYPWVAVTIAFLGQVGSSSLSQGFPALYPFIQEDLALSRAQVGLVTSALMAGGMLIVLIGGWLTDLLGTKRVMVLVLATSGLLTAGYLLVHSLPALLVVAGLVGIALGPMYPASMRAILDWAPRRFLGLAMSLKQSGGPVAGALSAAILPALAIAAGWRTASLALGAFVLLTSLVVMFKYQDITRPREASAGIDFAALRELARNRRLVMASLWAFAFTGLQGIVLSYFILFQIENAQISPVAAGGILALAQVSGSVFRLLWGAISDFALPGRRVAVLVSLGLTTTAALGWAALAGAGIPMVILVFLAIAIGASALSWHGVFNAHIAVMAGTKQTGTALGAVGTVMYLAMMITAPLFGHLVDISSYRAGWGAAAALALVSTVILLAFGRGSTSEIDPASRAKQ